MPSLGALDPLSRGPYRLGNVIYSNPLQVTGRDLAGFRLEERGGESLSPAESDAPRKQTRRRARPEKQFCVLVSDETTNRFRGILGISTYPRSWTLHGFLRRKWEARRGPLLAFAAASAWRLRRISPWKHQYAAFVLFSQEQTWRTLLPDM